MSLKPDQLLALREEVRQHYRQFVTVANSDTGTFMCADSGQGEHKIEVQRVAAYAVAHGAAHFQDGRMRALCQELRLMGLCDTGPIIP